MIECGSNRCGPESRKNDCYVIGVTLGPVMWPQGPGSTFAEKVPHVQPYKCAIRVRPVRCL